MQVLNASEYKLLDVMALPGTLFFLLTAPELRRQGLSFLALHILRRTLDEREITEYQMRTETGLPYYELSRVCKLLVKAGLVEARKSAQDRRVRVLTEAVLGRKVYERVLSAAADRLSEGIPNQGRLRRTSEATEHFRAGNRTLAGPFPLSFFDSDLFESEQRPQRRAKKAEQPRS